MWFSKLGVQFLGLGYYTEQNMDGIPSFVHCSVLRNGNHTLHQKVGVVRPIFFFGGGSGPPTPSGCDLDLFNFVRNFLVPFLLGSSEARPKIYATAVGL